MEWNKSESSELERAKMKDRFAVVFLLFSLCFRFRNGRKQGDQSKEKKAIKKSRAKAKQSKENPTQGRKNKANLNRVREAQDKNPRVREQKRGQAGGSELMKGKLPIPIRLVCSPLSPLMSE